MKVGVWVVVGAGLGGGAVVRWVCWDGWTGRYGGGGGACWWSTASVSLGAGMMWAACSSCMRGSASL